MVKYPIWVQKNPLMASRERRAP